MTTTTTTLVRTAHVAATTTVGLSAGVLFCFQVAVMPGLRSLSDRRFVATFQAIDRAIVGPAYLGLAFFGGAVALVLAAATQHGTARTLLGVATVVYLVGVVGITAAWHVPHNNALAALDPATATDATVARARAGFEHTWSRLNLVRTAAAVVALALVSLAATQPSSP